MTIYKWVVCKDPDDWNLTQSLYKSFSEANATAKALDGCVVELSFVYEDSELIQDYREAAA